VLIVVGKIKDIRHSPVGVGCSDGPISPFMLMYAVLAGGETDGPDFCQRVFEEVVSCCSYWYKLLFSVMSYFN